MIRALVLTALLAGGLMFFLWWFLRTPPRQVARGLRRGLLLLTAGVIIWLALTGRLPAIFAFFGALLPFVMRLLGLLQIIPLPLLQRLIKALGGAGAAAAGAAGQASVVETRFLRMRLDHDTGQMDGEVLEGRFKGARLADLRLDDLMALYDECRLDAQSLAVLEAYLDRMHPDWRDTEAPGAEAGPEGKPASGAGGPMTTEEALHILGLEPGASREDIIRAHRRLMQKLHPDHGGSDYLAAQINRAKDVLLGN